MSKFDIKDFLTENKLTEQSKKLDERVEQRYEVGDTVELTRDAVDHYGSEYRSKEFEVEFVSTSTNDHPGYDSAGNQALYDLKGFPNSVYDYELK